jgi:hypothetical protein
LVEKPERFFKFLSHSQGMMPCRIFFIINQAGGISRIVTLTTMASYQEVPLGLKTNDEIWNLVYSDYEKFQTPQGSTQFRDMLFGDKLVFQRQALMRLANMFAAT